MDNNSDNEAYINHAVRVLESIEPVANDLFQARKIGMVVTIPEEVEEAFVFKHGEQGRKTIDMLRGDVTL